MCLSDSPTSVVLSLALQAFTESAGVGELLRLSVYGSSRQFRRGSIEVSLKSLISIGDIIIFG